MSEKSLKQIFLEHEGKVSDKWSLYLNEWDQLFSPYRDQQINILEIGIQNGGSLEIWAKYFKNAEKIVGVDIAEHCAELQFTDERISVIVGDANQNETFAKVVQKSNSYEIIIDDGSHVSSDIIRSFSQYFSLLKVGGIYIVEDLHASYWKDFEGSLYSPYTAMSFFKRLADVLNFEHWRLNKTRLYYLRPFIQKYNLSIDEMDLMGIHSIEFLNSLCVIKKLTPDLNNLGLRLIRGQEEKITSNCQKINGSSILDITTTIENDESWNVFNMNDQIATLNASVREKDDQIANLKEKLNTEIAEREQIIKDLTKEKDAENENLHLALASREPYIKDIENKHNEINNQIKSALSSRSWRLTKPLRLAGKFARWFTVDTKAWLTFAPGSRPRRISKKILLWAMNKVYANPTLKAWALILLNKFPRLKQRLRDIYYSQPGINTYSLKKSKIKKSYFPKYIKNYIIPLNEKFQTFSMSPFVDIPKVSIIIPVLNKWEYTYCCLKSIAERTSEISYEVIVVDNGSSDETKQNLIEINNLIVVRNEENMGFIKACNQGAGKARGEYLLFLNNDTQVMPGWLDAIIPIFDNEPSVGVVGSKLLYPDGSLQEAGGIIWHDASGWNYGRGDNPEKPEYNFLRDVDYCSGACLAVRKNIFNKLGGFDELYFPAYYEDTDLCFSVRKLGYRVIYQPKCIVIHFEGITAGRDTSSGVKSFQEQNKPKFYKKWLTVLNKEHYMPVPLSVWQARVHGNKLHVLIIDHRLPESDKDAGSVRMTALINMYLMLGFVVTFYPDNLEKMEPYTSDFQAKGVEVIYGNYSFESWLKERRGQFHLVHMCRPHTCFNKISIVKNLLPDAKIIYDTIDLHFLREERRAKLENNKEVSRQVAHLKEMELYLARESDVTFVVTEEERKHLLLLEPDLNVEVISTIHSVIDDKEIVPFEKRAGLMFLGGYEHPPNVDAVLYFVEEIFPLIRRELPEVEFYVVGSKVTHEIENLKRIDGVRVIGWVSEVEPYFNEVKIFVSPLRYGAGMKGKIGHAMSCGLPVVTTSIGAEGMELIDGETALIANGAEEFAQKVVKLYQSPDLWMKLSKNGIEHIRKRYTPEVVQDRLEHILSYYLDKRQKGYDPELKVNAISINSYESYKQYVSSMQLEYFKREQLEKSLIKGGSKPFSIEGYCYVCKGEVNFFVDYLYSYETDRGTIQNWRERLICPLCKLNNRMRASIHLFEQLLSPYKKSKIYITEQTTPLYRWFNRNYLNVTGSEYLGETVPFGESNEKGLRNEDITELSFSDNEFNFVISLDVVEHVPNVNKAFQEFFRVLKDGGSLFLTVPFSVKSKKNIIRAIKSNNKVEYLLPPEYHGDPLNSKGCLAFYTFGWELLSQLKEAGFIDVNAYLYWSKEFGYLGGEQIVFIAKKIVYNASLI